MNFLVAIIAWIVVAAAHPSPPITSSYNESEVIALGYTAQQKTADCQRGKNYCYAQIVKDLGVDKQSILHQYCNTQEAWDAQSCHGCRRVPWPLPYCWDGPGAWSSVFECEGKQEYTFKGRCKRCEAGKCV